MDIEKKYKNLKQFIVKNVVPQAGDLLKECKSQAKEIEELKARVNELEESQLTLVQGYYNWIILDKPSVDDILDRLEIERKQLLTTEANQKE